MSEHVVIIGAVALGPKAACRYKRLRPDARVTLIDRDAIVSYGGCGIPYYISGDVSDLRELRTTSFKLVRDEKFFQECKDIEVLTRTEALSIDRQGKTVRLRDLESGAERDLAYDKLVLATGARPRRLGIPGEDLPGVHAVANLRDARDIRDRVSAGKAGKAVVVGSGFIGLEVAEALADMWGLEVAVVEIMDHVLPRNVSPALARMAQAHLAEKGVELRFGEKVLALEGEGRVERVVTDKGVLEADLVVLAAGVVPNGELARAAGLEVSPRGGVLVGETLRTSDPDIFAGGDCVEIHHLVTGKTFNLPLGSMANRQGRVIGSNLAGAKAVFPGAVGSFAVKVFDRFLCGAGLTPEQARQEGFDALAALVIQFDRAHFFPGKELMTLEVTVDRATHKVLGIQGFGPSGDALAGRVGAVAALMQKGCTAEDLSILEYPYSPPFSSAMDIVNTAGTVAENLLAGMNRGISSEEFTRRLRAQDPSCFFLDCREPDNAAPYLAAHPGQWHNIPQGQLRERLDEIPRDRTVVLVCNTGIRSYEGQITLEQAGFRDVLNVHGGMAGLKQSGLDPK
ncbi:NADH peroxidase [Fundidesulfovibrio magnetotacticus]|uniref:NADH peroxidase n=1 Tax=Fundidesulfovibrio magnetotacticus TaxID=2730080 RepID=A0A6V8LW99_9BACT|nr:FAD-dependent oxidoreductase [Fundidesulfovibrio magnetotacticus]GFK93937.1 NADH peroxidase [Fundidesulfovibrio magnetotacticus]